MPHFGRYNNVVKIYIHVYIEIHNVGTIIYKTGYMAHMASYLSANISFFDQPKSRKYMDRQREGTLYILQVLQLGRLILLINV